MVCRIGLIDSTVPYIVPMNFGYKDGCIYLHSASQGKKIDILRSNNLVCFEIDCNKEIIKSENPCQHGMKYYSLIGWGKIQFIENYPEKLTVLDIIMNKYAPDDEYNYDKKIVDETTIMVLRIDELSGKISGY